MDKFRQAIDAQISADTERRVANGWRTIERPENGHTIGDFAMRPTAFDAGIAAAKRA